MCRSRVAFFMAYGEVPGLRREQSNSFGQQMYGVSAKKGRQNLWASLGVLSATIPLKLRYATQSYPISLWL